MQVAAHCNMCVHMYQLSKYPQKEKRGNVYSNLNMSEGYWDGSIETTCSMQAEVSTSDNSMQK